MALSNIRLRRWLTYFATLLQSTKQHKILQINDTLVHRYFIAFFVYNSFSQKDLAVKVYNRSDAGNYHFCDLKMTADIIRYVNIKKLSTGSQKFSLHNKFYCSRLELK